MNNDEFDNDDPISVTAALITLACAAVIVGVAYSLFRALWAV